jgi:FkbM family methyltransferase
VTRQSVSIEKSVVESDWTDPSDYMPCPEGGDFTELARCRRGPMLYNRNNGVIGASPRKHGEFSGDETALFADIVHRRRTVLDVGADLGVHTVDLSGLTGPSGVVHAFEPKRLMFQLLCANVALSSRSNVFPHQAAVGANRGKISMPSMDPRRYIHGGPSISADHLSEAVPIITIDSPGLDDCRFIRLELNGMEIEALRGAVTTIEQFRPILCVGNNHQIGSAGVIDFPRQYGYRLFWHHSSIYTAANFRKDPKNIFGSKVLVSMICIPTDVRHSPLIGLREVTGPADSATGCQNSVSKKASPSSMLIPREAGTSNLERN